MKQGFQEIFNYFGQKSQRNKLCEEFREFQDELHDIYDHKMSNDNLLNEGVDVMSLILQFLYDNGIENEEIIDKLQVRLKRTLRRKNDGYYGSGINEKNN